MKQFLKILGIYIAFLAQSIFFENVKILSCSPDVLIVAIIICSVSAGTLQAALAGGLAGFFTDVMCGRIFGLNILVYMYLAIIVSIVVSDRIHNSPVLMGWTTFVVVTVYEVVLTLFKSIFGYSVSISFLGANILVKGLFGAIVALCFVAGVQKITTFLNNKKTGSVKEEQV